MQSTFISILIAATLGLTGGCGGVADSTPQQDAEVPAPDAPSTCTIHNTVQSCGATCAVCPTNDRATASCNGTACGLTCNDTGPRCSDDSCSRLAFDFESNTLEDVRARSPSNLPLAVRNKDGTLALAIDLASLTPGIQFTVPVCLTGTVDVHTRTLKARVMFDGGEPSTIGQYYVQAGQGTKSLAFKDFAPRMWLPYTAQMSVSQTSNAVTEIVFEAGTFGAAFAGTIWFDDITIE
jgi:hypothetical protein